MSFTLKGVSEVCCNQKKLLRNNHCRCFRLRLFKSVFWMMLPITRNTFGKQKSEDLAEQTNYISTMGRCNELAKNSIKYYGIFLDSYHSVTLVDSFLNRIFSTKPSAKKKTGVFFGELMYTPGSTNIAGWKMDPLTEDVFPIQKSGAIPAIAMLGTTRGYLENLCFLPFIFRSLEPPKKAKRPKT